MAGIMMNRICYGKRQKKAISPGNRKKSGMKAAVFAGCCLWAAAVFQGPAAADQSTARKAAAPVQKSIEIRRSAQKNRDQWENQKAQLIAQYESLQQARRDLEFRNRQLEADEARYQASIRELWEQKIESERISQEMMPFLARVYDRLTMLLAGDPPFLKQERAARLARLAAVLDAGDVSIAEKYRKVMEALFIEAEYGTTIEVYRDKILFEGNAVLGDIFRLGRVSLFFLSLDRKAAAVYSVRERRWEPLPGRYTAAVQSAVEIGGKKKPAQLLALPIGRLAVKGGE